MPERSSKIHCDLRNTEASYYSKLICKQIYLGRDVTRNCHENSIVKAAQQQVKRHEEQDNSDRPVLGELGTSRRGRACILLSSVVGHEAILSVTQLTATTFSMKCDDIVSSVESFPSRSRSAWMTYCRIHDGQTLFKGSQM